ncbi:MAG: hypothetical protein NTX61_05205 [Bacteroidetes bacterium]|nr:hypothetical protein [Bacteroidota bacterium]
MKKKALVFAVGLLWLGIFSPKASVAQKPMDPMGTDTWTLNFGIGPGINYATGYAAGFGPGFQVSAERGGWKLGPGVLSLGAEFGFNYFKYSNIYPGYNIGEVGYPEISYSYKWYNFILAPRASYHYGWKVQGLDTYGGISTGCRFVAFSSTYSHALYGKYHSYTPNTVSFHGGIFLGGSYFFTPNIGVNSELGYNVTYIQIGMVFRLN